MSGILGKIRAFFSDRAGNSAVEFALLSPIFFPLMTGTLETTLMMSHQGVLENAVFESARRIRTGEIQGSVDPLDAFESELCDALIGHVPCNELYYNVKNFSGFGSVDMEITTDDEGNPINGEFDPGISGDITAVRVAWKYSFHTPFMSNLFGTSPDNSRLLMATAVFRNEPYRIYLE